MNAVVQEYEFLRGIYEQASTRLDSELGIMWFYMNPHPRPCFTPALLRDIQTFQKRIALRVEDELAENGESSIQYVVLASSAEDVFNLGGDLDLFVYLIRGKQRDRLLRYAHQCVEAAYEFTRCDRGPTSISLVRGKALGGGFEAALSCNVVIAEKSAQMGLPEVLFNLFPGMGAYSYLSRRLTPAQAERMILSGKQYEATELHEMGVVDVLADDGCGEQALYDYVKKARRHRATHRAMQKVRNRCNPLTFDELVDVTDIWVDAALTLNDKDIRTMERLVKAQDRKATPETRPGDRCTTLTSVA